MRRTQTGFACGFLQIRSRPSHPSAFPSAFRLPPSSLAFSGLSPRFLPLSALLCVGVELTLTLRQLVGDDVALADGSGGDGKVHLFTVSSGFVLS